MSQIDISQWKEFKLTELFTVSSGTKFDRRRVILTPEPHNINFIGRTGSLNGINAKCGTYKNTEPFSAGLLTVALGGTIGACFVQNKPFYTSQNVDVLIPLKCYVSKMTWNVKQFIASCIFYESQNNYLTFVRELNKHIKRDFVIKLPVTSSGQPDWQYMDTYIAKLTALAHKNVISLKQAKAKSAKLNIDQWGEFKISDILSRIPVKKTSYKPVKKTSYKATDLVKEADSINTIPLVAAGVNNQGVTGYAPIDNLTILQNCLTVSANGANSGTVFYQNRRFSILQDAYALELIDKTYRIDTVYIYLASLLTKLLMQNDWTNKATWNIVKDKHIKLPIDAKGKPDWEYMSNQVCHLAALSDLTITSLRSVI